MTPSKRGHRLLGRDGNVLRVDFSRRPEPPSPTFPGAGALRMARDAGQFLSEGLKKNTMRQDDVRRRIRGHQANLERYARMLSTNLTELERQYIHRRIAEEHSAITRLEAGRLATSVRGNADPETLIAARAAARQLNAKRQAG